MREHLIIFVKAPRPGTVKTRLGLGNEAACAAYSELVEAVLAQMAHFSQVELRFTPADGERDIRPWLQPGWSAVPQAEGDLGGRLQGAFSDAFALGATRVLIIGSDCPYITAKDISQAWEALEASDLVLGPAEDGGYWLIGLRNSHPALFTDMPWSTSEVFTQTVARAESLGLKTVKLRTLSDVDTWEDWENFTRAKANKSIR